MKALTDQQNQALRDVVAGFDAVEWVRYSNKSGPGVVHWRPANALLEAGLIRRVQGTDGYLVPTDEGLDLVDVESPVDGEELTELEPDFLLELHALEGLVDAIRTKPMGDPIRLLEVTRSLGTTLEDLIEWLVLAARAEERSWSEIGSAIGTTKQAAHERWSPMRSTWGPNATKWRAPKLPAR